jgi:hypothetical protein
MLIDIRLSVRARVMLVAAVPPIMARIVGQNVTDIKAVARMRVSGALLPAWSAAPCSHAC